jgi:N-terminal 7TM region of histidine kinase
MSFQYSPYIIPLLIAALISFWVAVYCWPRRRAPTALAMMILGLAITEWSIGYALEIAGTDLETKLFWGKMQYLAIPLVPVTWLAFSLSHGNFLHWLTWRSIPLLLILPISTIALVFTNEFHKLIWGRIFFNGVFLCTSRGRHYHPNTFHGPHQSAL